MSSWDYKLWVALYKLVFDILKVRLLHLYIFYVHLIQRQFQPTFFLLHIINISYIFNSSDYISTIGYISVA